MIVYAIRNTLNGKQYVGATASFKHRKAVHTSKAFRTLSNAPLHVAMRTYGMDAFEWRVLSEAANRTALKQLEYFWIKELGTFGLGGYNTNAGGTGWYKGQQHSPQARAKLRDMHIGMRPSPETLLKLRISHMGKKQSPEVVAKRVASTKRTKELRKLHAR
jgi:group I intron endonuclease